MTSRKVMKPLLLFFCRFLIIKEIQLLTWKECFSCHTVDVFNNLIENLLNFCSSWFVDTFIRKEVSDNAKRKVSINVVFLKLTAEKIKSSCT